MFAKKDTKIKETLEARKQQIAGEDAWNALKGAGEIVVGRGKSFQVFTPSEANKSAILESCLGRTGNLRAPTLKVGNRVIVGFNEDMYMKYLDK